MINEFSPKLIIFDEEDEEIEQEESNSSPETKEEYESINLKKLCQNEVNKEFYGKQNFV